MGSVVFTARESLLPGRAAGSRVALDIDLQDAIRTRNVRKFVVQASNGDPETLYEGADTQWELVFAPRAGDDYARMREFLDSIATGESFQVWIYGTESAPITCKRTDNGGTPALLIETGDKSAEPFSERITCIEV